MHGGAGCLNKLAEDFSTNCAPEAKWLQLESTGCPGSQEEGQGFPKIRGTLGFRVTLGIYWHNGKENGRYYILFSRVVYYGPFLAIKNFPEHYSPPTLSSNGPKLKPRSHRGQSADLPSGFELYSTKTEPLYL